MEFEVNLEKPPSSPHMSRVTSEASYSSNIGTFKSFVSPFTVTRLLLSSALEPFPYFRPGVTKQLRVA